MIVLRSTSRFDRHPDFKAAESCARIKFLAVPLEVGRIGKLVPRAGPPDIPDGGPRATNRGDVLAVSVHRILLRRNSHVSELRGKSRKAGDLRAAQVIEVPFLIDVPPHAVRGLAQLSGNIADVRHEPLPL